jgi:hypothetical protein
VLVFAEERLESFTGGHFVFTGLPNQGGSLERATAWLRMTPQRLLSLAECGWRDASPRSSASLTCARWATMALPAVVLR